MPFSCLVPDFVMLEGRKHICLFHALFLTLLRLKEGNIFPFSCLVPDFVMLGGRKHICLFPALFLPLFLLAERHIFGSFLPRSSLRYPWRKETYLPFSCLVPDFVTLTGRKLICFFHALSLTLLHSMKHISLFHAPTWSIFPLVSSFF